MDIGGAQIVVGVIVVVMMVMAVLAVMRMLARVLAGMVVPVMQ